MYGGIHGIFSDLKNTRRRNVKVHWDLYVDVIIIDTIRSYCSSWTYVEDPIDPWSHKDLYIHYARNTIDAAAAGLVLRTLLSLGS